MGTIIRVFVCSQLGKPVQEVPAARAIENWGLEGCAHARRGGKRQVLLMDVETLTEMEILPGHVKENLLTQGFNLRSLQPGQRLRIGQALLEVTLPCTPCNLMESIRPGLEARMRGKRGMLCRVLEGGTIRHGDAIALEAHVPSGV